MFLLMVQNYLIAQPERYKKRLKKYKNMLQQLVSAL